MRLRAREGLNNRVQVFRTLHVVLRNFVNIDHFLGNLIDPDDRLGLINPRSPRTYPNAARKTMAVMVKTNHIFARSD